jgi:hypothetical protein
MTKSQFNPADHSTGLNAIRQRIKAGLIAMPSEREKPTEELDKFLAEPNEAEDSIGL